MPYIRAVSFILGLLLPLIGSAMPPPKTQIPGDAAVHISAFRQYGEIVVKKEPKVPTIVDIPLDNVEYQYPTFIVLDTETGTPVPSQHLVPSQSKSDQPIALLSGLLETGTRTPSTALVDGNELTTEVFSAPAGRKSAARIILSSVSPVETNMVHIFLSRYSSIPETVQVFADGVLILGPTKYSSTISFPRTSAREWMIDLLYSQTLVIQNISLVGVFGLKASVVPIQGMVSAPNVPVVSEKGSLRFLYEPGHRYRVYVDPDRQTYSPVSGNYAGAVDVLPGSIKIFRNPGFVPSDIDADGVSDQTDNCPNLANPTQEDENVNGKGDACEDFDLDLRLNGVDNCPNFPNWDQRDTDGDGIGDPCDKEESRPTERYPWVPWVGMGTAALVILVLFVLVARKPMVSETSEPPAADGTTST